MGRPADLCWLGAMITHTALDLNVTDFISRAMALRRIFRGGSGD